MAKKKSNIPGQIIDNRKARHDYTIVERFEAGVVLTGWEVKSLKAGRGQLRDSYVIIKKGEAWLLGSHFTPLTSASTHVVAEPSRSRKLLLHKRELNKLIGAVEQKGCTLVALSMYWKGKKIKLDLALVKGKKQHDKRASAKEQDWNREKQRLMKSAKNLS